MFGFGRKQEPVVVNNAVEDAASMRDISDSLASSMGVALQLQADLDIVHQNLSLVENRIADLEAERDQLQEQRTTVQDTVMLGTEALRQIDAAIDANEAALASLRASRPDTSQPEGYDEQRRVTDAVARSQGFAGTDAPLTPPTPAKRAGRPAKPASPEEPTEDPGAVHAAES